MASAVFEGTSLVNMFVRDCWPARGRGGLLRDTDEWSDRNILYLHRSYSDLGRLFKRLLESFPEDRGELAKCPLMKTSVFSQQPDLNLNLNQEQRPNRDKNRQNTHQHKSDLTQANKHLFILKNYNIYSMVGNVIRIHSIQDCVQEIMRSNGFCLANTETIVFDQSPEEKERPSSTDSAENTFEDELDLPLESELCDEEPEAYVTNLSYYHLVPFETDILE
ncbi:hypothetical protein WMY93_029989 [Mugilogobius chulae]|uniref:PX domain-containing protein n=1 Tax=Mugilogobius chulae TaxID=88201 RepID=A0AAW0MMH7_9GOBI